MAIGFAFRLARVTPTTTPVFTHLITIAESASFILATTLRMCSEFEPSKTSACLVAFPFGMRSTWYTIVGEPASPTIVLSTPSSSILKTLRDCLKFLALS